jgi:hypothetical protein
MQTLKSLFHNRAGLAGLFLAGGCMALIGSISIFGQPTFQAVWSDAGSAASSILGQAAARDALADESAQHAWPFEVASGNLGDNAAPVRHLGFSAVLNSAPADATKLAALSGPDLGVNGPGTLRPRTVADTGKPAAGEPHLLVNDIAVGDRVTVVSPDGLSHVYKVTAREVVGPQTQTGSQQDGNKRTVSSCQALNSFVAGALRLVIEAVQIDHVQRPAPEQKL